MDIEPYFIPEEILSQIDGGTLFWPYSDLECSDAVVLFAPYISDFYFVDPDIFWDGTQIECSRNRLPGTGLGQLVKKSIIGAWTPAVRWLPEPGNPARRYKSVMRCTLMEKYVDQETGRSFTVRRIRADPYEVFRSLGPISVFYWSHQWPWTSKWLADNAQAWLATGKGSAKRPAGRFLEVLDKLTPNALIVTDGKSLANQDDAYGELRRDFSEASRCNQMALSQAKAFTDDAGRDFRCVGYGFEHYDGPSLVWQCMKPNPVS